jgi:hypothetical protein
MARGREAAIRDRIADRQAQREQLRQNQERQVAAEPTRRASSAERVAARLKERESLRQAEARSNRQAPTQGPPEEAPGAARRRRDRNPNPAANRAGVAIRGTTARPGTRAARAFRNVRFAKSQRRGLFGDRQRRQQVSRPGETSTLSEGFESPNSISGAGGFPLDDEDEATRLIGAITNG